jgi:hypothetical protein
MPLGLFVTKHICDHNRRTDNLAWPTTAVAVRRLAPPSCRTVAPIRRHAPPGGRDACIKARMNE